MMNTKMIIPFNSHQSKSRFMTYIEFCDCQTFLISLIRSYRKIASNRQVYYLILETFGQRSQYISIKFPIHKLSEYTIQIYNYAKFGSVFAYRS